MIPPPHTHTNPKNPNCPLDIQVFWNVVTLRLMRGSWHFEGLLCFHLQVSNMDVSTACKVSFFLDCLTLEDESYTILQNTVTTHSMTWSWILSTRFVWMEMCNTRLTLILLMWNMGWTPNNANKWQMGFNLAFKVSSNMNSARLWFSGMCHVSSFCLSGNNKIHAAYTKAQTHHTTQRLPAISKRVTIARQTTRFPIQCCWSERQMDGWQWTAVETAACNTLQSSRLRSKKKESSNVNSSTPFLQWLN